MSMKKKNVIATLQHPKTLILGVYAPYNKTKLMQSYFDEFFHLVKSNDITYDIFKCLTLRSVDKTYFLTKGKLELIERLCKQEQIEELIISEPLTAKQESNLSDLLKCRIFDRTHLILEIFEKAAHSAEGKIQVAIALCQYRKSRIAGAGIYYSQQAGHIGGRGPGETAKERELRHLNNQISKLKKELKHIQKIRQTQRKKRLETHVPHICLIGYTNTGKSTLLNTLTKASVLAQDKLFATLDTTTRELFINGKKKGIISDTVGFIQQLPHFLIESFKSTLAELAYADLLIHVIDITDPNWEDHIAIVHEILHEIGIEKEIVYVFNKTDRKEHAATEKECAQYQPNVSISAQSKKGTEPLLEFLNAWKAQAQSI